MMFIFSFIIFEHLKHIFYIVFRIIFQIYFLELVHACVVDLLWVEGTVIFSFIWLYIFEFHFLKVHFGLSIIWILFYLFLCVITLLYIIYLCYLLFVLSYPNPNQRL